MKRTKKQDAIPAKRATKAEIARWLDISERSLTDYIGRLGLKPGKDGKYATLACFKEHLRRQLADPRQQTIADGTKPPIRTWADVQKQRQVQKLDIEISTLQGNMVAVEEVQSTISELCSSFRHSLENWVQLVAGQATDGQVVKWAEEMRDRAIDAAREAVK